VKLVSRFADFLRDTVNLNQTRVDGLEASVEAIKAYIKDAEWKPRVWKFVEQGSWAHGTIIRPVDGKEFDADLLAIIDPVDGWSAAQYVSSLGEVFENSGLYKDKAKTWEYCVTITYAGDRKIDIAPCIRGREADGELEVCNRPSDMFERSEPVLYTEWLNERNGYSGSNSFRKVTRLIKYLRDIREDFECSSVILTTIIGQQIAWSDKGSDEFKDVPTTLKTIVGRLDDWLQSESKKPPILNPQLASEDFAEQMSDEEYEALRSSINAIRQKVDAAYATKGRNASIDAWREVFGDKFAKGVTVLTKAEASEVEEFAESEAGDEEEDEDVSLDGIASGDAAHDNKIVELIARFGRWIWKPSLDRPKHMSRPIWTRADIVSDLVFISAVWRPTQHSPEGRVIRDFDELTARGGLEFDVTVMDGQPLPPGHYVRYRVTNTGAVAMAIKMGRGGFEKPQLGTKRWEQLAYTGVHLVEAFVIRESDRKLVGQSAPFHVRIR